MLSCVISEVYVAEVPLLFAVTHNGLKLHGNKTMLITYLVLWPLSVWYSVLLCEK